jgi:hypothetical protein
MSKRPTDRPDHELNVKVIVLAGLALLLATAVAGWISWWLSGELRDRMVAEDPPPPALLEAMAPYQPPTPNLQIDTEGQLRVLRAEEAEALGTWEWTEPGTSARVPIERGMELLLETRADARAFGAGGETANTESEE